MGPPLETSLRREVIALYKEFLNLSKDYPLGQAYFRKRLHAAFSSNAQLCDEAAIRRSIERAQFVQKEIEALESMAIATKIRHIHKGIADRG